MGEENKIRDAADAVKGILEAVPVYQDVAQPAAKEVGTALQTVAKTIHIVLAPVAALVWGYEKISEYLNRTLSEKLKDVPPERIVAPSPAVAGLTVEALKFVANEPDLREMYANLLATSMDKETAQNAHPAFVEFIRQMTADEARILEVIALEEIVSLSLVVRNESGDDQESEIPKYAILSEKSKCEYPDLIPSYLDNLRRLGLTQHREDGWHKLDFNPNGTINYYKSNVGSLYSPVDDPMMIDLVRHQFADELRVEEGKKDGRSIQFHILSEHVQFTSLGEQFARACIITWDTGEPF